MTATDTQPITTALAQLYTDAAEHGWQADAGRNAVPGKWVRELDNGDWDELTIVPPVAEYGIAIITAHTDKGTLRLKLEPPADLAGGIRILRGFLGWPEDETQS